MFFCLKTSPSPPTGARPSDFTPIQHRYPQRKKLISQLIRLHDGPINAATPKSGKKLENPSLTVVPHLAAPLGGVRVAGGTAREPRSSGDEGC